MDTAQSLLFLIPPSYKDTIFLLLITTFSLGGGEHEVETQRGFLSEVNSKKLRKCTNHPGNAQISKNNKTKFIIFI